MTQTSEYGFDTTMFDPGVWEKLLEELQLEYAGQDKKNNNAFMWAGKELTIFTSINPITRERNNKAFGLAQEEGIAGYIGITGSVTQVAIAVHVSKRCAAYIKGESSTRDYI